LHWRPGARHWRLRIIPFQAMATSVPEMTKRGSFNALGAAIQQVSVGIASVIAGHIVTMAPDGKLEQFPVVAYVVVCATLARWSPRGR